MAIWYNSCNVGYNEHFQLDLYKNYVFVWNLLPMQIGSTSVIKQFKNVFEKCYATQPPYIHLIWAINVSTLQRRTTTRQRGELGVKSNELIVPSLSSLISYGLYKPSFETNVIHLH